MVTKKPIPSCKALDIGCGTGDNSIWLAQNGFRVAGTDTSDIALKKAKEKASKANVECDFMLVDFLKSRIAYRKVGPDLELVMVGPHENYYRDLKQYLKN